MRSGAVVLGFVGILAAGCGFRSSLAAEDAGGDTGPAGGGGDGGPSCTSFATLLDTCTLTFSGDLVVSGMASYDTTTHMLRENGAMRPVTYRTLMIGSDEVDVLSARDVQVTAGASLRATGTRPLAIVAMGNLTIGGAAEIDVSRGGGAGARMSCAGGPATGAFDTGGGGGGGGGGLGADGGKGGDGNGSQAPGGAIGHALGALPGGLRGGCPGATGGTGNAFGGAGGAGGGALYLAAAGRIQLDGQAVIDAGGDGGHGGQHLLIGGGDAGGGGGGSGGMVVLEAPHIVASGATIAANGGGGGGGSDDSDPGGDGARGTRSIVHAEGGTAASNGTDGGRGGVRDAPAGDSVIGSHVGAGGGGGGGVGFIRILSSDAQLDVVSPVPVRS